MTDETPKPPLDEDGIPILTEVVVPGDTVDVPELNALVEPEPEAAPEAEAEPEHEEEPEAEAETETKTPEPQAPAIDEERLAAIIDEATRDMREALLDDIDNLVRTRIHDTIEVMLGQYETTLRERILEQLHQPAEDGDDT